jgi:hypothetical protein
MQSTDYGHYLLMQPVQQATVRLERREANLIWTAYSRSNETSPLHPASSEKSKPPFVWTCHSSAYLRKLVACRKALALFSNFQPAPVYSHCIVLQGFFFSQSLLVAFRSLLKFSNSSERTPHRTYHSVDSSSESGFRCQ